MKYFLVALVLLMFCKLPLHSQVNCNAGQVKIKISVFTDSFPTEISWQIVNKYGVTRLRSSFFAYTTRFRLYTKEVCISASECAIFSADDYAGDGIAAPGYIKIEVNGVLLDSIPGLQSGQQYLPIRKNINCQTHETCDSPRLIQEGEYLAKTPHHWYTFIPDSTGYYTVTTCYPQNSCDTKLWITDKCLADPDTNRLGAIYYSDNSLECALKAHLERVILKKDKLYYIHVYARSTSCTDSSLLWRINYHSKIKGCMDSLACNYNPLAQVDSICYYSGDPNCKEPDLMLREDVLRESLILDTIINNDPCLINEGCLTGYGVRNIIRFSTRIDNIGKADYFIGEPDANPDQFSYDNCHRHYHYTSYAEYQLFDNLGRRLPSAFKNGFCVLDLICPTQIMEQYGCQFMGITAGCSDEYDSSLECQWIDVTNLPDGDYTFAVIINWEDKKDASGRKESHKINNWGQFCFNLNRSTGRLRMTQLPTCNPYRDCTGELFGSAIYDCEGNCNGSKLIGDLDRDGNRTMTDVNQYISGIISQDISTSNCNDLNANGKISVFDADLLANCINFGKSHSHIGSAPHNHCVFPFGTENIKDSAYLKIVAVNTQEKFITIGLRNPKSAVNAMQFKMKGIKIDRIENLKLSAGYSAIARYNPLTSEIITFSEVDSSLKKSNSPIEFLKIYYSSTVGELICIEEITDLITAVSHERLRSRIEGNCYVVTSTNQVYPTVDVRTYPNPASNQVMFSINQPSNAPFQIKIYDINGRALLEEINQLGTDFTWNTSHLSAGIYIYKIYTETGLSQGKIVIEK